MRIRSLLALGASAVLAAAASAGVFDSFVSVLDARASDPALRLRQARAIESARRDVTDADLLLSQARAARSAERRIRAAFGRSDPLRASAGQMLDGVAAALAADVLALEARRGTVTDPGAAKRLESGIRLASRDLIRADRLANPAAVANALVAAGAHLRRALPPQPDFTLTDANPVSSTYRQEFTPRGFPGRVTAWYFIHTT